MKDKEKQIEEMAKHGCYDGCASGWRKFCDEYDSKPCKNMVRIASGLYEQGYRKLPKNSVVLSKKERMSMCVEQWDKGYKQARKEMTKEIITKIRQLLDSVETIRGDDTNKLQPDIGYNMREVDNLLDELAKQLSVEIKE